MVRNDWPVLILSFIVMMMTLIRFDSFHWWAGSAIVLFSILTILLCVKSIVQKQVGTSE